NSRTGDILSVKDYSAFFRILYNATYLSKEMSEKALSIMARSDFDIGITAGVPNNIHVSNKFGERGFVNHYEKQFHDCGIVYYPGSPYLLCVMTKGSNFETQIKIIAEVSALVYKNVASRVKPHHVNMGK